MRVAIAAVVSSSDVAIYQLRMAGWIWKGAKRCPAFSKSLLLFIVTSSYKASDEPK